MLNKTTTAAALIGALWIGGCATQDYVDKHVATVQSQVTDAQTQAQAEAQAEGQRLDQLDQTTREALQRAEAAGKLAEGKFLYSVVLSDDGVRFRPAKTDLTPDDQAKLTAFAEKLKSDNHNVYVEIQGHTDATGAKTVNYNLGAARAESVRLFLNKQGVPLNRMSTISYGADSPVQSNKTRAGRAANRRVVLVVLA